MRAICWNGINDLRVEKVKDPCILSPTDAIVKVRMSSVCGSDLHLIGGYVPTMRKGDILGHEFIGEVVEVGPGVKETCKGSRVVVCSLMGCGECFYCQRDQWSLCDNTNPNHVVMDALFGDTIAGVFGYSHAAGGFAGSHAEYVRVPLVDHNTFRIPDEIPDESAVFISDAVPTGYMGADMCNIQKGDVVAVWGCGGVGLMAIQSAYVLGAERVIAIDRFPERLRLAQEKCCAEVINYEEVNVREALREMTGGRGPDACIDAVGMEADTTGLTDIYDRVKQKIRLQTDRPQVIREAILSCRKGGTVSIMGVYMGFVDKIPIGAAMNKALTLRMGQQFGQKYIPRLFDHVSKGELNPSILLTHRLRLEDGPRGYKMFKRKEDACVRAVFTP
jgi:threonine dehydrogenase-like Zn-dependent dehydrogenase